MLVYYSQDRRLVHWWFFVVYDRLCHTGVASLCESQCL
jgi:hypothetical protein